MDQERAAKAEQAFIAQMRGFLDAHGTAKTDVGKLLYYASRKTGVGFNYYGVTWTAQTDSIKCHHEWSCHSFFDDGGGEEGHFDWSITFIGSDGDYPIQNEKLDDLSTFYVSSFGPAISDAFYCSDPFGLSGIYRISFEGAGEETD